MKTGIAYYRVSTANQKDNTSLEDQRKRVRAFCVSQDIELVAEFQDVASGGTLNRPGYQKALDYLEESKVDCFLVFKLDRAHRHQQNLLVFEANLRDAGISFISASELIDTSTAQGKLMFQILGSFAEFERETIRERTARGKKAKLAGLSKKESVGGRVPFGYDAAWNVTSHQLTVKAIFREYLRQGSLAKVIKALNLDMSRQTVHGILTCRAYLGEYQYGSEVVKGHHKPIIAPSVFGKVRKALQRKGESK